MTRTRTLAVTVTIGLGLVAAGRAQSPSPPASQAPSTSASGASGVAAAARVDASAASKGLTAVPGVKVGHHTLSERPTGCTVILLPPDTLGSVDVRGGAPGTKETDLLDPVNNVQVVHAVVLSGGSAFGLDSATGVMKYLEEQGIGYGAFKVPIVPAAILFDLPFGNKPTVRPGPDCGYQAAKSASEGPVTEGNIGAGAGATVGKMGGRDRSMKAGVGSSAIVMPNGLVVAALVAVNAVGDVIDPSNGQVVAGVRTPDGKALADARKLLRTGNPERPRAGENTTIGIIVTNAKLTKAQALKVSQMAHDGFARAISPVHTPGDGDTIFAMSTGSLQGDPNLSLVGALAADAMADAIIRAATQATSSEGVPAARDLGTTPKR
jgi:L-aminopeptidase/D-esterase-like protein